MGLLERLRDAFGTTRTDEGADGEPDYRCLKCGAGYDREQQVCSDCGSEFVAPTDPRDETEERG